MAFSLFAQMPNIVELYVLKGSKLEFPSSNRTFHNSYLSFYFFNFS